MPPLGPGWSGFRYRSGESAITIEGRNLFPHFEDLQAKHCDTLRESDHAQETAALGVPYMGIFAYPPIKYIPEIMSA